MGRRSHACGWRGRCSLQPECGEAFAFCSDESINCNFPVFEKFISFRISRIRFLIPTGARIGKFPLFGSCRGSGIAASRAAICAVTARPPLSTRERSIARGVLVGISSVDGCIRLWQGATNQLGSGLSEISFPSERLTDGEDHTGFAGGFVPDLFYLGERHDPGRYF